MRLVGDWYVTDEPDERITDGYATPIPVEVGEDGEGMFRLRLEGVGGIYFKPDEWEALESEMRRVRYAWEREQEAANS